jgi:outer membrane protein assembly factor BamB
MKMPWLLGLALMLVTLASNARADDWPQWNGPARDGISKEKGLLKKWPANGPALAWTFNGTGIGFSAPAVVGNTVYILGSRKGTEYVIALDAAAKGAELWATEIGPEYDFKGNQWSAGPNSTPSVDGDHLYAVGSQGIIVCLDLKNKGKQIWTVNMPAKLGGKVDPVGFDAPQGWGFSGSPLVDGDKVICTPGGPKGLLAALDKKTGALIWQSKDVPDEATYSSPIAVEVGGIRHYVAMTGDGAVGIDAATGGLLWRYKRAAPYNEIVAPTPIFYKDHVLISAWKGGPDLIKLTAKDKGIEAAKVYSKNTLQNEHGGLVLVDGYIYGSQIERDWRCVEFKTGGLKWSSQDLEFGSVIYADGNLYCLDQNNGTAALVEASPEAYNEISRFTLPQMSKLRKPSGKVWTHPVIANGYLYLRDQELLFCYKVK